jgi:cation transport ATPase
VAKFKFGSDLLAGISIVTAVLLGEYLAGALVVLMLSGGEALESYAIHSASSVLRALAQRMPSLAHRRQEGQVVDVPLSDVMIGDTLVIFPHDICPVDGIVTEGRGIMDESFLTRSRGPRRLAGMPISISTTSGRNSDASSTAGQQFSTGCFGMDRSAECFALQVVR